MDRCVALKILFFCGVSTVFPGSTNAAAVQSPYNVFYVFGGDFIYVIEPESRRLIDTISNVSSPGICTKGSNRVSINECWFSGAQVIDGHVYALDYFGGAVKVIEAKTRQLKNTIKTDELPVGVYDLRWRREAWVHSWSKSTLDVIKTDVGIRTHNAIKAHVSPGWTHGDMIAHEKLLEGRYGYVTHITNTGMHKVNLDDKTYVKFLNFSGYGCTGTWRMAFSPVNHRIYVECRFNRQQKSILELDPSTDKVKSIFPFPGRPYASPNGHYIVTLYRNGDISRVNIIDLSGQHSKLYHQLDVPGGVTDAVFYPKSTNPDSYYVFMTLQNTNRMAVIDLELASRRDNNAVKYINDVDFADTTRFRRSRKLFINGKWIISAASKTNTAVIVNAETHKVHGKIVNIDHGDEAIWVHNSEPSGPRSLVHNSGPSGPRSFLVMIWLCLSLKFFF